MKFLEQHAGASREAGHLIARFRAAEGAVKRVDEGADVLALPNGRAYVCADYAEALVYGADGSITPRLGLNLAVVADALRQVALSSSVGGAAWLRWQPASLLPKSLTDVPLGFLGLLRQHLRRDASGAWSEVATAIHLFAVTETDRIELSGDLKATALRALVSAVVRKSADANVTLGGRLRTVEREILAMLRQPSENDLQNGIRPAVLPIFSAVVTT